MEWKPEYKHKTLIMFDLDGTLAESKSPLDDHMRELLGYLLSKKQVAILSGGRFEQFEKQILKPLDSKKSLGNLFLFPACATSFYKHTHSWQPVYRELLSPKEKKKILSAFDKAFHDLNFEHPARIYGEQFEDKESQITFSANGNLAPYEIKSVWDPDTAKRLRVREALLRYIPEFEIRIGGTNSIDITRSGIDKAYGIGHIEKYLGIPKKDMLYFGDALFPGGNDYPVYQAGVSCVKVSNHHETKDYIRAIIS